MFVITYLMPANLFLTFHGSTYLELFFDLLSFIVMAKSQQSFASGRVQTSPNKMYVDLVKRLRHFPTELVWK